MWLDQYVLSQAGKLLREQRRNHQPMIPISVNFSRVDFLVTDPFQLVEKVVRKYGLQRNFLCIEVTESALVQHSSHIFQTLQKFHNSGYKIWLDDFGSAYSSLNVLHNYHFDELKIDQAFLKNLNDKGKEIITSIVLMAKTLGVHTLAEGVETEEQLAFLKKIGCEKIQGFYYSRPLPYEKLLTHLMKMHIKPENSLENQCYEQAGLMNVVSEAPLGLFRYTRKYATLLYINEAYQKVLASVGTAPIPWKKPMRTCWIPPIPSGTSSGCSWTRWRTAPPPIPWYMWTTASTSGSRPGKSWAIPSSVWAGWKSRTSPLTKAPGSTTNWTNCSGTWCSCTTP